MPPIDFTFLPAQADLYAAIHFNHLNYVTGGRVIGWRLGSTHKNNHWHPIVVDESGADWTDDFMDENAGGVNIGTRAEIVEWFEGKDVCWG